MIHAAGSARPTDVPASLGFVGLALQQPYSTFGNLGKPGVTMTSARGDKAGQTLRSAIKARGQQHQRAA